MKNIEYANAYSEVLEILNYIKDEDYKKIPKDIIDYFVANSNEAHNLNYNPNIQFDEQNISNQAKSILAILFTRYWATDEQKQKIAEQDDYYLNNLENEKRKKYNPDNLFQKNEDLSDLANAQNIPSTENTSLIVVKDNFFKKLIKKVLNRIKLLIKK